MNIKNKNSIYLLLNLFDSNLIDKNDKFLAIASELTNSVMKIYAQGVPTPTLILPSDNFDKILDKCGLNSLKMQYSDIYNGIKFILNYKPASTTPTVEELVAIGINNKNFYVALLIATHIAGNVDIINQFFPNNILLNFLYDNSKGTYNLNDVIQYLKGIGFSAAEYGLKKLTSKDILSFFNKIQKNIKQIFKQPASFSSKPSSELLQKTITKIEYQNAFDKGVKLAKNSFQPYMKNISDVDAYSVNKKINEIINNVNKEFFEYIYYYKNNIKAIDVEKFTFACYMVVAMQTIGYKNDGEINIYYQAMNSNFSKWKQLRSLSYLNIASNKWGGLSAEKAKKIYTIIKPIIEQNIINFIPEEYKTQLIIFIEDIKNGLGLTNIFEFCKKYEEVMGIVDSSKLVYADYVLNNLGNNNANECARLILQRIEGYNAFSQTAKNPSYVESLQKMKNPEEINEEINKEQEEIFKYKNNIPAGEWLDSSTIKMAGCFLYKLYLVYNKMQGN